MCDYHLKWAELRIAERLYFAQGKIHNRALRNFLAPGEVNCVDPLVIDRPPLAHGDRINSSHFGLGGCRARTANGVLQVKRFDQRRNLQRQRALGQRLS